MKKYLTDEFMDELRFILEDFYKNCGESPRVYDRMADIYNTIDQLNDDHFELKEAITYD